MKEEKGKLILVYVLMLLVIGLIVALTLVVLNNNPKNENKAVKNDHAPKIDVNPYPEISAECTFNLTIDEYNALTGPKCKNGYSRYNLSNVNIDGKNMLVTVIYNDLEGDKKGLFLNDRRVSNIVTNVINYKFYVIEIWSVTKIHKFAHRNNLTFLKMLILGEKPFTMLKIVKVAIYWG